MPRRGARIVLLSWITHRMQHASFGTLNSAHCPHTGDSNPAVAVVYIARDEREGSQDTAPTSPASHSTPVSDGSLRTVNKREVDVDQRPLVSE